MCYKHRLIALSDGEIVLQIWQTFEIGSFLANPFQNVIE